MNGSFFLGLHYVDRSGRRCFYTEIGLRCGCWCVLKCLVIIMPIDCTWMAPSFLICIMTGQEWDAFTLRTSWCNRVFIVTLQFTVIDLFEQFVHLCSDAYNSTAVCPSVCPFFLLISVSVAYWHVLFDMHMDVTDTACMMRADNVQANFQKQFWVHLWFCWDVSVAVVVCIVLIYSVHIHIQTCACTHIHIDREREREREREKQRYIDRKCSIQIMLFANLLIFVPNKAHRVLSVFLF